MEQLETLVKTYASIMNWGPVEWTYDSQEELVLIITATETHSLSQMQLECSIETLFEMGANSLED